MATPKFRFGGYMNSTGGGKDSGASSSYGGRPTSNNNRENYRSTGPSEAKTKSSERLSGTIRDTKAEAEANEGSYLDNRGADSGNPFVTYRQQQESREKAAYDASKKKQEAMQRAIDLAYNVNKDEDGNRVDDNSGRSTTDQSTSNFQNLTDAEKQILIDSGFAAAESSGVLGGTMGAELVTNQLKKQLAEATTDKEATAILGKLKQLGFSNVTQYDPFNTGKTAYNKDNLYKVGLGYDQSAVYDFNTLKPYERNAFYDMQSPNLTTKAYTNYMNKFPAFGHSRQGGIGFYGGGGGGGYGGGGGGGDGGSSGGPPPRGGMPQGNPNDMFGAMSPLQQAMITTNAAKGFSQGYKRGGIVSLVK
mgnify:CR=1 FL=1|tara:strand:- start:496 stop:1581 length:1086 start_codon:yes stop_codon:yes gene_type:complete